MIQVNELRMGNKFYFPFHKQNVSIIGFAKIEKDDSFKVQFESNGGILLEPLTVLKPIELTTKILTNCGLKTDDNGNQWFNLQTHYLELILAADGFYYPIYVQIPELSCEPEQRINLQRIKYVHQLQNLIFVLTGTELNLNKL